MKSISLLLITFFLLTQGYAQDIMDGLRYSLDNPNGSARYLGLSGAMGALGGDFSAMSKNPAGSAVFLASSFSASLALYDRDNETSYFGSKNGSINTRVDFNQVGGVFVFNTNTENSPFKKFTIGLNYDNSQNYDDELYLGGNSNVSIDRFFLQQAQGIPLNLLQLQNGESIADLYSFLGETEGVAAQNAFLGYQGFIFDPVDPENTDGSLYVSNIAPGNFDQEYSYLTSGYNAKYTLNFGTQVSNDLFFGINLNSHTIDYRRSTFLFESNSNAGSTINEVGFENNLTVVGAGFSAQLGAIAKLGENFRLGLNLDSPTYYQISEETTQFLQTTRTEDGQSIKEIVDPRVLNVYDNYNLRTPAVIGASAAYVFGPAGLISFDYGYKDYSTIEFSPTDDAYFSILNGNINSTLKGASTYKVGGEYRINQLSLRGGYRFEESPYKNENIMGSLNGFSLGLGYNMGNYSIDLAYSRAEQNKKQQLYNSGLTTSGDIKSVYTNLGFTLGFKF